MDDRARFEGAMAALRGATSLSEARRTVDLWAPRFHDALAGPVTAGSRPDLRMEITVLPGASGLTARRGDSFLVGIGEKGGARNRFTLAHELAHVLLNLPDQRALRLSHEEEEDLCDRFARRALAPPALVRRYLDARGIPTELADVKAFAARFRITLRASLVALDEFFPPRWPVAFLAAGWRGHPRRKEVLGLRIDASAADRRVFLPAHCRLSTLGFRELEAWALDASPGDRGSGRDEAVAARSARAGTAAWTGVSAWSAERHLAPGSEAKADRKAVLCRIDLSALRPQPTKRRRRTGAVSPRPAAPTGSRTSS